MTAAPAQDDPIGDRRAWLVTGVAIIAAAAALAGISEYFGARPPTSEARAALGVWGVLAGGVYFAGLLAAIGGTASSKTGVRGRNVSVGNLGWVCGIGLVTRLIVVSSSPCLEDDFYRYLWDGAVAAHGMNPYRHAPADVLARADGVPDALTEIGCDGAAVLARVSHPQLTSMYGPVAQLAFAAAHVLSPWNIIAWRAVLLAFDVASLGLLILILRELNKPLQLAAWYWWNPVLLREVIGSGHMDVIAFPFVLGAILLAVRGRCLWASIPLTLAAAAKIWPVLLLPLLLRHVPGLARRAGVTLLFTGLSLALWLPAFASATGEHNGFRAFAASWHNNSAVFPFLLAASKRVLWWAGTTFQEDGQLARMILITTLSTWIGYQTARLTCDPADFVRRALYVITGAFLLSPAQFPWYYLWMLPLLAMVPRPALLAYSVLIPLYYLHYDWPWITWIEHLPILAWLALDALWRKPRRVAAVKTVASNPEWLECTPAQPSV